MQFFNMNNKPFNETRDFLMEIQVKAGSSTYY